MFSLKTYFTTQSYFQVPTIRVANDSRELILNCCTEFIHLISSEANDVCNQRNKKTINAEHVLEALDRLGTFIYSFIYLAVYVISLIVGFKDYKNDAEAVLNDCKAVAAKRRRQSTRLENLGIPEEELLRQQQELFAKAREEQAAAEQAQWFSMQAVAQQSEAAAMQRQMSSSNYQYDEDSDEDEY